MKNETIFHVSASIVLLSNELAKVNAQIHLKNIKIEEGESERVVAKVWIKNFFCFALTGIKISFSTAKSQQQQQQQQ